MISIIVPVYNVEEYLEECLESIRKQTYQDIEVILVNDGSTDGSQAICERYCQMDKRFRLINQKNQGQSVARNRGVKESLGEYIMFVDSDDVVSLGLLEQLMKYMSDGIDIVECNITEDIHCLNSEGKEIGVKELDSNEALYECFNHRVSWSPVAKLYRREIVEKVPFLENLIYEDFYTGIVSLKYIHKHKTGKLIKLPIEIACIIADVSEDKRLVLEEYAELIGLAFQVKDDILDIEGTFEDLGKPVGSDDDLHKATYPSILGMEESKKILNETVERAKKIIHNMFGEEKGKILISLADFIRERKS